MNPSRASVTSLKLANYRVNGEIRAGLVHGGFVFDIEDAAKELRLQNLGEKQTIDNLLSNDRLESLESLENDMIRAGYRI